MKRATITLDDELEAMLEAYRTGQEVSPSLTSLVQVALRRFLSEGRRGGPEVGDWTWGGEVAEPVAVYGEPLPPVSRAAPGVWGAPPPPRARDLPGLLAALPRLSEDQAEAMARDLERGREALDEGGLRDPWSAEP